MTDKYYKIIANRIKEFNTEQPTWQVSEIAYALANDFEKEDPKFNRSQFLESCGVEE